jgi:hypothetical protein
MGIPSPRQARFENGAKDGIGADARIEVVNEPLNERFGEFMRKSGVHWRTKEQF